MRSTVEVEVAFSLLEFDVVFRLLQHRNLLQICISYFFHLKRKKQFAKIRFFLLLSYNKFPVGMGLVKHAFRRVGHGGRAVESGGDDGDFHISVFSAIL